MEAQKIQPGYVHIKATAGSGSHSKEGITQDLCRQSPSQVQSEGGALAGFSVVNGEAKIHKEISNAEKDVVVRAVEEWKRRGAVGFNMDVRAAKKHVPSLSSTPGKMPNP